MGEMPDLGSSAYLAAFINFSCFMGIEATFIDFFDNPDFEYGNKSKITLRLYNPLSCSFYSFDILGII
jgi:hypothetical protein